MTTDLAAQLVGRRDTKLGQIDALKRHAAENETDLTDADLETIDTLKREIGSIDTQLEAITDDLRMSEEAEARLAKIAPAAKTPAKYRSMGAAIYDALHLNDPDSRSRMETARKRAVEHMGLDKDNTVATAGDIADFYVDPIVGPVIVPYFTGMPFVSAVGVRPMPAGSAFERPYIVDPALPGVQGSRVPDPQGGQAAPSIDKSELVSQAFSSETEVLKRTTIGQYLNVAQQVVQWQPGSLQMILDQMRRRHAWRVEWWNLHEMANRLTATPIPITDDTVLAALYQASAAVFDVTQELAEWVVCGPAGWARLGGVVDKAGRPLLPNLQPVNAAGSMQADDFQATGPAGLRLIVTPAVTDDSLWVGNGSVVEIYGYMYPAMEALEPSVLGRQIAVAGDYVNHCPAPFVDGLQKLVWS